MTDKPAPANAIVFIFITVLINMIGFGIIVPVMPTLIMDITGEDLSHAAKWGGILSLVYAMMQFLAMPVMGALSDRFGRRPVILGSLAAYSADFFVMAVAPSIGILLVSRLLAGAFAATFSTANAFIADITPPEKRAANFGLMGAAFGLGFIIGPGLGGVIAEAATKMMDPHFGARAPFYVVAALGLANLVYGSLLLPESLAKGNRRRFEWKRANAFGTFMHLTHYPALAPIALTIFFAQLAQWTMPSVWAYFAEERFKWSPSDIGYSLMLVGLTAALVQGGLARLVIPRIGERKSAFIGVTIAMIAYLAYGLATKGWMIYAIIPFGALAGFAQPSLQGIMSRTIPANAQGELQGAVGSIAGFSMIIGPYLMTQVFAAFIKPGVPFYIGKFLLLPHGAPFYFAGAPFIVSAILTFFALLALTSAVKRIKRPRASAGPAAAEAEAA
ncbi:MAG TPA: TCR/Tet family MFS transporter [Parvularculaceae bacterium]|nr:TCR/Tet family MFS transporter [Parvularculaceae bacterium]